jgi:hypothetical protein
VLPKLLSELQNSRIPELQNSPISPKAIVFYLPVTPLYTKAIVFYLPVTPSTSL